MMQTIRSVKYQIGNGNATITIPTPNNKYLDQFFKPGRSGISTDLLATGVFPNTKEVTESFAAVSAFHKHFKFSNSRDEILFIVPGDGASPRTGTALAFKTKHQAVSVDPELNRDKYENRGSIGKSSVVVGPRSQNPFVVNRLGICKLRLWEFTHYVNYNPLPAHFKMILVGVHDHVPTKELVDFYNVFSEQLIGAIHIPCCFPNNWDNAFNEPQFEYEDWGIHSPHRTVKVWKWV